MKIDLSAKDSLEKNGVRIIREGFAAATFGVSLDGSRIQSAGGETAIRLTAEDTADDGGNNSEEFLIKPFRILSAVVTPGRFIDFTTDGVLKAAVPLFEKLTIYANHNADVNQWKGYTTSPVWDDKNKPAGINANMVIDRTVDANLARGLEIGALRSASVTIWFEYEKSHPDLRYYWDHVGTEVDGEIVRFIVTRITRAAEVSVVWEGEDPYAKALSLSADDDTQTREEKGEDMKFSKTFLTDLGMGTGDDITAETLETKVLNTIAGLKEKIAALEPEAATGKQHLQSIREKAATLYKTLKGDSFRQEYVDNVILKADLETAQALADEYGDQVEKTVPLTCPKCGEKTTRRSSQSTGDGPAPDGKRVGDFKC